MENKLIALWYGLSINVPHNWFVCDGSHGTPDLRDRFPRCVKTGINPGVTGGSANHSHTYTMEGHKHFLDFGTVISGLGGYDELSDTVFISGISDEKNNLPPYKSLFYIMLRK